MMPVIGKRPKAGMKELRQDKLLVRWGSKQAPTVPVSFLVFHILAD